MKNQIMAQSLLVEEGELHNGSALVLSDEGRKLWDLAQPIPFTTDENGHSFKQFEESQFSSPVYIKAHMFSGVMYVDNWFSFDLKYFNYGHLPLELQPISSPFYATAIHIACQKDGFQRDEALQRLLEAKDCCVRSAL